MWKPETVETHPSPSLGDAERQTPQTRHVENYLICMQRSEKRWDGTDRVSFDRQEGRRWRKDARSCFLNPAIRGVNLVETLRKVTWMC